MNRHTMIGNLFKYWTYQVFSPGTVLREKYEAFRSLLEYDQRAHEGMAELQRICYEALPVDANRIFTCYDEFARTVGCVVDLLEQMCPRCYVDLKHYHIKFDQYIRYLLAPPDTGRSSVEPHIVELGPRSDNDFQKVGGKAHAIIRISESLPIRIPRGFVITANAYRHLIEHNRLDDTIRNNLARIHPDDPSMLSAVSDTLIRAVMEMEIPPRLVQSIKNAYERLFQQEQKEIRVAVRSSAAGEDSDISFAGQYRSCLEVRPKEMIGAYRRVLASRFSPAALYYRIRSGLEDPQTPMAVIVMEMIAPRFSGVLYTRGPTMDRANAASIHYVTGLGEDLVSGERTARVITIPHGQNHRDEINLLENTTSSDSGIPLLDVGTASTLSHWALQLEHLMKTPCDVEWCQDVSGRIYLLQSRPLRQEPAPQPMETVNRSIAATPETTMLYKGGLCACSGEGSGPIHKITSDDDLQTLPEKSVALLTTAPPHYVPILDRVNAVIIERGSVAGHFQAVAREFNIPTLVNAENAGHIINEGEMVTVCADKCEVMAGSLPPSAPAARERGPEEIQNPLQRKLAAAMDFISPLEMVDPHAPTFKPQSCRSMHDILRFAHEKAIYEMFSIGDRRMKRKGGARRLIGDLPMVIYILDVGGGVKRDKARNRTIRIDDLECLPFHALWRGLLHPDIHWAGHHHFDWAEYDRMVMNGGIINPDSAMLSSYAVVADRYLNFCLKFGYHFAIIDALFQEPPKNGHIWFRFTGGGADVRGRLLRVRFTKTILSEIGFSVKTEGELINARLEGYDTPQITESLEKMGHLLGVTRLMDMHLQNESDVDRLIDAYLNGRFKEFIWEAEEDASDER